MNTDGDLLRSRFGQALRTQAKADSPHGNAFPCPYGSHRGRIWKGIDQLFDHVKDEHAAEIAGLEPRQARALVKEAAIDLRRRNPGSTYKQGRQRYVSLSILGHEEHAFPDNGAEFDLVSLKFAEKHQLTIDAIDTRTIVLPNNNLISTMGSVSLSFRFDGEKETFQRTFHVLKGCVHHIVLGRSFLEATRTLTTFVHRIRSKVRSWFPMMPHVLRLGSLSPRVLGSVNGIHVNATDDIGSDINAISLKEARRLGLRIKTEDEYKIKIGYADGSTSSTFGTVVDVEWRFVAGSDSNPIRLDLHVLKDLNCDMILGNEFLFDNDVFDNFIQQHSTLETCTNEPAAFAMIMVISDRNSIIDKFVASFRSTPKNRNSEIADPQTYNMVDDEVARQLYHQEQIEGLPSGEQQQAKDAEDERRRKWKQDHTLVLSKVPSQQASPAGCQSSIPQVKSAKDRFRLREILQATPSSKRL